MLKTRFKSFRQGLYYLERFGSVTSVWFSRTNYELLQHEQLSYCLVTCKAATQAARTNFMHFDMQNFSSFVFLFAGEL